MFKFLQLFLKPIITTTYSSDPQCYTKGDVAVQGLVVRSLWQQIHVAINWFKINLSSMRLFTINKRVSRTSNWSSLYLTVNFLLLLREFNQSVNFSTGGTLSNKILISNHKILTNRVETEHCLACYINRGNKSWPRSSKIFLLITNK